MRPTTKIALFTAVTATILSFATVSRAQTQIYSQDFDTDTTTNWVVNTVGNGFSYGNFFFDYSTAGIPSAPHSTGGSTLGLKLGCNLGVTTAQGVFPAGVSVSPLGFGISDNFEMHFDLWMNYNKSGVGSTEIAGAGFGTAGTQAQVAGQADSVFVAVSTDGGTSADYRVYAPAVGAGYQDADHSTVSDTNTPYVYAATNRNNAVAYYTNFLPATPVPQAQTNLFPSQTGLIAPAGTIAFAWHDVSLTKIGNIITYKIDGHLIATINVADATKNNHPFGGTNILFEMSDINAGGDTDADGTNILFALIDNVRITNFPNIVTVTATQPNASEAGPTPGTFTITRTAAGVPLTVYYTLTGTAVSGTNFQPLPGSISFSALDTATNISVVPIDDGIPTLPHTVVLNIVQTNGYIGAGNDTVTIADNDPPAISLSAYRPTMFERHTNDFITFRATRVGATTSDVTVNLTYSGTAAAGVNFAPVSSVLIPGGQNLGDFNVTPIDNQTTTGPLTVIASVAAGTGYSAGANPAATGTILDDENFATTIILSDSLTNANDGTNWNLTYGVGDTNFPTDYEVIFGYDIIANAGANGVIGLPPSGATNVLRVTCNKASNPGSEGAVNLYYTNQVLSGDFAVRFSMNLCEGQTLSAATEGAVFGINHTGTLSNWWYGSGTINGGFAQGTTSNLWASDGVWYWIASQGNSASAGDFIEYTGIGGTNNNIGWQRVAFFPEATFANVFKGNPGPYNSIDGGTPHAPGVPANASPLGFDANTWSDVEIKQIHNVVSLSINKTLIFAYTNTTVWTNGYLMLGYSDPYGGVGGVSVGSPDGAVYYSDLNVVQLSPPNISTVTTTGGNVTITFTSPDSSAAFKLLASTAVTGPFAPVAATVTSLGGGIYRAVVPQSGPTEFFEIGE